ncbi:GLUG motif-containing protein, partial [Maribellus maritimus]|uniref:GLUG motif-containing protein n=1 Tax=Maribellus maritimus TaxID=2870838 RepID=UPI001EEBE475
MKLYYLQFIVFFLIIQCNTFAQTAIAPLGDGSTNNPYQIASLENLYWISQNYDQWDKNYIQNSNIDASSTQNWTNGFTPIGNSDRYFTGTYDGQDYTINNLSISNQTYYSGLFGQAENASFSRIGLTNVDIEGRACGSLASQITGCHVYKCYSTGSILGSSGGGLLGTIYNSSLVNCYSECNFNSSNESSSSSVYLGGLASSITSSTLIRCHSKGKVSPSSRGTMYLGGFAGSVSSSTIDNCYSTSEVGTSHRSYGGGFIAYAKNNVITNCYSTGKISGSNVRAVSSFIGYNGAGSSVANCYCSGRLTYTYTSDKYGFIYENYSTLVSNNFYDRNMVGWSTGIGGGVTTGVIALTTTEMKTKSNFTDAGWDFAGETANGSNDYWEMDSETNNGYPFLSYTEDLQTAPEIQTGISVETDDSLIFTINLLRGDGEKVVVFMKETSSGNIIPDDNTTYTGDTDFRNGTQLGDGWFCIYNGIDVDVTIAGLKKNTGYTIQAFEYMGEPGNEVYLKTTTSENPFTFNTGRAFFAGGNGSEENPYQVQNLWHLNNVRKFLNANYIQTANIDASSTNSWNSGKGWEPIGDSNDKFCGSYNGQGYSIDSLFINRPNENNIGLFGNYYFIGDDTGILKNLKVTGCKVTGYQYVGILCGRADGVDITNCQVSGELTGEKYTGGLAGYYYSKYEGVFQSSANVILNSDSEYTGGLFGQIRSSAIRACYARVSSNSSASYGGLAGYMDDNTVVDCYATGVCLTGGLVSPASSAAHDNTFENCYSNLFGGTKTYLTGTYSFNQNTRINYYYDEALTFSVLAGKSSPEMKMVDTYSNWDIDDTGNATWTINKNNNGYPYLSWQQDVKTPTEYFAGGDGSVANPYQVATAQQLHNVYHYPDAHFIQTADINLNVFPFNQEGGWLPIGNEDYIFNGTYNGNGYTIDSLMISVSDDRQTEYFGLFGYAGAATLKNIKLTNIEIDMSSHYQSSNSLYTGGLAGYVLGTNGQYAEISNCNIAGTVNNTFYPYSYTGGVISSARYLNVKQTSFKGTVISRYAAGFAYSLYYSNINESCVKAEITSSSKDGVGFCGSLNNSAVSNCYVTGSFTEDSDRNSYGFNAGSKSSLTNCYAAMSVATGNFYGYNSSDSLTACFWDTELGNNTEVVQGIGLSTKFMTTKSTFLSYKWNFDSIWGINGDENNGYPFLQFEGSTNSADTLLFAGGDGSKGNPYLIATPLQLYNVRNDLKAHYRQVADIDLSVYPNWLPIGGNNNPFKGTYDGNGFTISNLTIESNPTQYAGLFSYTDSAKVYNIRLDSLTIINVEVYSGGLTGYANASTFTDIVISNDSINNNCTSGGVAGYSVNSAYNRCSTNGYIENVSRSYYSEGAGGLIGYSTADTIHDCHSSAIVSGYSYIGGLIGHVLEGKITNSSATGNIRPSSSTSGGFIGYSKDCNISFCFASGDIITDETKLSYAGGFVGRMNSGNLAKNCYATGNLNSGTSYNNAYIGGFCGSGSTDTLYNCYSVGYVLGSNSYNSTTQGFIGSSGFYGEQYNCFFDKTTSGKSYDGGSATGKTTDEMQESAIYLRAGWDFLNETANGNNDYWGINKTENDEYPFLAWQGYVNIPRDSRFYVKHDAGGAANGKSWINAFTSLTIALTYVVPGDTIWVAEGTYSPDGTATYRNFSLSDGITLLGGFEGTETVPKQRDWDEHQVILTGGTRSVVYMNNISACTIDGFTIRSGVNNYSNDYGGGGIYKYNGSGTFIIRNCTFKENTAEQGGAVCQYNTRRRDITATKMVLENCIFIQNSTTTTSYKYYGGAVANISEYSDSAKMVMRNCLFTENKAYKASAVYSIGSNSNLKIINSTFYNNFSGNSTLDSYNTTIINSIFYANSFSSTSGRDIYKNNSNEFSVSYSNIEGSGGSDNWDSDYGTDDGNNIDKDPFWTDADNDDLNPTKYSWCVDTGTPDTTGLNLPETDLKGNPRIYQGNSLRVDMGAYECQNDRNYAPYPPANNVTFSESTDSTMRISWSPGEGDQFLVFLSADTTRFASPENNKSYLSNTQFLQGDQIENSGWYAVYDGADTTFIVTGLDTAVNYKAHVIAHYTGKLVYNCDSASGNPAISTRCVTNNNNSGAGSLNQAIEEARSGAKTICFNLPEGKDTIVLSEQIELRKAVTFEGRNRSGSGTNITITVPEPGVSTWRAFYVRTTCTIKNMTITGGSVNNGGAMYIYSGKTTLKNVTVSNSKSTQNGGGIYANSDLILENCKVVGNTASSVGGGIFNRDYLYIINSSVSNNSSSYGAGIYNSSNLYIYNTTINKNEASGYGGGIYNNSTITNSSNNTIVENTANLGGGIYNRYRIRKLSFNTISRNKATSGSGIYQDNSSSELTIQNTILANNYSETGRKDDYYGKYGELTDNGYNIIGSQDYYPSSSSPKFTLSSNENIYHQGTIWKKGTEKLNNQKLGLDSVLTDNGGATFTLTLSDSSFAAGAGITDDNVAYDQRGVLRTEPPTIGAFGIEGSIPGAVTKPATDITAENITLNGTVNPNGYATSITFEYGKTESYGNTIIALQSPVSGFGEIEIAEIISGLDADETYHYRIVAENTIGKIYGEDVSFKTARPEISFFGNSTEITNGDNTTNTLNGTNFESILVNTPKTFSFLIKNSGTGPLQLTGTSLIKIIGSDSLCFSVSKYPAKSIVANDTSTFEITFTPDTIRSFSASLKIENNVPENNPFIFSVSGSGIDTIPPVFTETPPSNTLQSCDAVTDAVTLTATDNFDTEVDIDFSEVYSDSLCDNSYTITRKWTATDNCGNKTSHTQVVTIQDTISPVFVESLPADTTQNCDAVTVAATLTA